jgi:hypothetical protein
LDFDKVDNPTPNDAFILKMRGNVKQESKDNQGTLDKVNIIVPNDALMLKIQKEVKQTLEYYEITL